MRTMNEMLVKEVCPPALVSKFTNTMRDFDKLSLHLYHFTQFVLNHYQWLGAEEDDKNERICTLEHLGYLLHRVFYLSQNVYEERGTVIRDEHCDWAVVAVKNIDEHVGNIETFVEEAEVLLQWVLDGHTTESQLQLIKSFKGYMLWLHQLAKEETMMGHVSDKCRSMNLHHGFGLFGVGIDNFRQQSFAAINTLCLLTVPSHIDATTEDFANLFQVSLDTFYKSCYWTDIKAQLEEDVNADFDAMKCTTHSAKMERLKEKWWGPIREKIKEDLKKFGIPYINSLSELNKGKLCRRLYERLNNIRIDNEDKNPLVKMSNDDLCRYFELEAELRFFAEKIEKYRVLVNDPMPLDEYFEPERPRQKIRDAIYKTIHEKGDGGREVLYMQSHWFAIHKVFEFHQMCCGTLKDFNNVMNDWFPKPPHPCEYASLKNMKVPDIRQKCYTEWSAAERANIPYRRVALTLAKYLREEGLID